MQCINIEISFNLFLDELYSPEITEAAARSHGQSLREQNAHFIPQYPSIIPTETTIAQIPQHEPMVVTSVIPRNDQFQSK